MIDYNVQEVPINSIFIDSKFNFRGYVPPMDVLSLAKSIKDRGLDTPITIQEFSMPSRPEIKWRVVAGHRRLTAHWVNQAETIPAFIRKFENEVQARIYNLLENVERKDLNIVQEAEALSYFYEIKNPNGTRVFGPDDLQEMLKQSPSWIKIRLELLKLDPDIRAEAATGLLSQDHIRTLVKLGSREKQIEFIKQLKDKKLKGEPLRQSHSITEAKEVLRIKVRKKEEITELKEFIFDIMGPNLATRVLAYADGNISFASVCNSIKDECDKAGIPFTPPESIKKALMGDLR